MTIFKLVRKVGKMLRGGAGNREIFLGAFCGVLIGFNPVGGLSLFLLILLTLLLNANIGFVLLGGVLGKLLSLLLAPLSFHTGYFLIHQAGLESFFTWLANTPFFALMGWDVYAMAGSLPYALILGVVFAKGMVTLVTRIREQMIKAGEHEKLAKLANNKVARFLMWLVFGKQKVSVADVLEKKSPVFRKSGVVLVLVCVLVGAALEMVLLDQVLKHSLKAGIEAETGAEVDIEKVRFSLLHAKLEVQGLEVTDPDRLEENLVAIKRISLDLSTKDLLRKNLIVDELLGDTVELHAPRKTPGKRLVKNVPESPPSVEAEKAAEGKPLTDYFEQAKVWEARAEKLASYLQKHQPEGAEEATASAPQEKESKKATALADAKKWGYLHARADLRRDTPAWTIRSLALQGVSFREGAKRYALHGKNLSSHPELEALPTQLTLTPEGVEQPVFMAVLHFENPGKPHELQLHLTDLPLSAIRTSDSFPLDLQKGTADLQMDGTFLVAQLHLPFRLTVHHLQAQTKGDQSVLGMDPKTANEVFQSLDQLEIDGALTGPLYAPRVKVDAKALAKNMEAALVSAGKKELSKRANKELEKGVDKLLEGEDAQETKEKAKGLLKKFF